jgi:reactive intermediate/imine deaminase
MSKPSKEFISPETLIAPGPARYSHIAKVNHGTIVYLSGQVPSDASGNLIGEGDFEAQVEQVFRNLKIAIEAAGGTMADIVKLTVYLCDMGHVREVSAARARYFSPPYPASTMIEVSRLVSPDQLVEIEAVAALEPRRPPDFPV